MNPKERYYSGVARETIHRITANRENWTSFLATMLEIMISPIQNSDDLCAASQCYTVQTL